MEEKRINKAISDTGFCSRRAADSYIEQGRVTVNGAVAVMGLKVTEQDEIRVDGKLVDNKPPLVYIALNKPRGIECTTNRKVRNNIVDFVNHKERIFPIGRLDKDSEGLILLTNDGDIVNKILRARNNHEKEYIVTVNKPMTDSFLKGMGGRVPILDTYTRESKVEKLDEKTFRIILTQGLNRQIRRMTEHFGYRVVTLKRIRIMNIELGKLALGRYRSLSPMELSQLNDLLEDSYKTID
ncbi:23S rRNA pseudouridine(2604) synthase RluF [Proteiniclasticum sp.]|jgi:23S rRNA pseudouridine2604 synthase|uniref:23S rRNA pseudouridine(2604) synthase RluF n=1 Tax=Proteiniclasticum sp. TaxID=2053595 RepID=UPI000E7E7221|nr:23S rRNA pseudouridine(2604) synthase RluF [Proteiniclasticum sp.]HBW12681.1 23S rRNA pseudouridine(2604) synthase RluF [Proteiniclasticum sp.]